MIKAGGLRAEILINLVVLLSAALVFVSILQLKVSERELLRERVTLVVSVFEVAAAGLDPSLLEREGATFTGLLPEDVDVRQLLVIDANEQVLFRYRSREQLELLRSELNEARLSQQPQVRVDYDGAWWSMSAPAAQRMVVTLPLVRGSDIYLQADVSLEDLRERLFSAQKPVVLYLLLFGAILTVFGGTLIDRTVVQPIRKLMLATQTVARGDLSADVSAKGLREVSDLATSFNTMTSALRESRQETAAHIEELSLTNRELREARDELVRTEKLASVGHLAAGMAHEIGNPLGALVGYLGLLEQDLPEESRELVKRSQAEAERIDRLVRELLDYAAPAHVHSELFDPLAALEEALELLAHQQALENLHLSKELPQELPRIAGSRAKLVQVFLNLLLNARDASPEGGEVSVSARRSPEGVAFEIRDSGSGIEAQDLPHIFDPFFTTKPQGKGRGLGLAVCHHVIAELGGRIDVRSEEGRGTSFRIEIPRAGEGEL